MLEPLHEGAFPLGLMVVTGGKQSSQKYVPQSYCIPHFPVQLGVQQAPQFSVPPQPLLICPQLPPQEVIGVQQEF